MNENQLQNPVRKLKLKIKRKEDTTINPLTLTEDQQRYWNCQLKSLGLSYVRVTAFSNCAKVVTHPPTEKTVEFNEA